MKILVPFVPHLARECLEKLGDKKLPEWPEIDKKLIDQQTIKIAVQVNGKTREVLEMKKDLKESDAIKQSKANEKVSKYIQNKEIFRTIYVKNRIINFLIK